LSRVLNLLLRKRVSKAVLDTLRIPKKGECKCTITVLMDGTIWITSKESTIKMTHDDCKDLIEFGVKIGRLLGGI